MHYRNGREAHNGDIVLSLDGYGNAVINAVGVLYGATAGNDYCNGNIAPIQMVGKGACLIDCLHIEDVMAILAEKGLDKRPAGSLREVKEMRATPALIKRKPSRYETA